MTTSTALPPHLRARYGLDRRPIGTWLLVGLLVAGFTAALAWVGYATARPQVTGALLLWNDVGPDRVDVTFEVRRGEQQDVWCVIRAQDESRADVGYAVVAVPRGTTYQQVTYSLRTLAPAYITELLACGDTDPPERVLPPQFPAGVVPPEQPWTP